MSIFCIGLQLQTKSKSEQKKNQEQEEKPKRNVLVEIEKEKFKLFSMTPDIISLEFIKHNFLNIALKNDIG